MTFDMDSVSDDACKQLWAAVLHQAIEDAMAPKPVFIEKDWDAAADKLNARLGKRKTTAEELRRRAKTSHAHAVNKWKTDRDYIGSRSFREVCWLCGLDPEAVEWRVRQKMAA